MNIIDKLLHNSFRSLPGEEGVLKNYPSVYAKLENDLQKNVMLERLHQKILSSVAINRSIRNLKKLKTLETAFTVLLNRIRNNINSIAKDDCRDYYLSLLREKIKQINETYDRSLLDTRGFRRYFKIKIHIDLEQFAILIEKYTYAQNSLLLLIDKISDPNTQLNAIKKQIIKSQLLSLYNTFTHNDIDYVITEQSKIKKMIELSIKEERKKIDSLSNQIDNNLQIIDKIEASYESKLHDNDINKLYELSHEFLLIKADVADSKYVLGKLKSLENTLYSIEMKLSGLNKRKKVLDQSISAYGEFQSMISFDELEIQKVNDQIYELNINNENLSDESIKRSYDKLYYYKRSHIQIEL